MKTGVQMKNYVLGLAIFCTQIMILGMEDSPKESAVIEEKCLSWPTQDVVTLKQKLHDVESSIMFFVPKNKGEMPSIGYLTCSCESKNLSDDPEHQKSVARLFKLVIERLASLGFSHVRFTARLMQRPTCLTPFIQDPSSVPIISQDGVEITISTHSKS
jgi:hypothetical protein